MTTITPFTGSSQTITQPTLNKTPSLLQKIFNTGNSSTSRTLEDLIDVNNNLQIYSNQQLQSLNPKVLYGINQLSFSSSVYRHQREEALAIPDEKTVILTLMNDESQKQIESKKHNFIHLGLIAFGFRTLVRKGTGAMALVILFDDRHYDKDKSIVGLAEIDLNAGSAITYIAPNFVMTIDDFCNHIKIAIQTRGFENFTGKNIGLDLIFLGKTMSYINSNYKLKLKNLIDSVSSKGIKFIPGKEISSLTLAGLEWNIQLNSEEVKVIKPQSVSTYTDRNNRLSIRFEDYIQTNPPEEEEED